MQVEANSSPDKFKIEKGENGKCTVLFFDNIKKVNTNKNTDLETEKVTKYIYDMYSIDINSRENIEQIITDNYDGWLSFAKDCECEKLSTEIRNKRDELLSKTDWTQMADSVLSDDEKEKYKTYRQILRDIPDQKGFPYEVVFPPTPNE